ncbi:trans-sulfuration enzyme family protein [Rhodoligotrophos defluvii]|uniref:trans-sulfuration enzyme family protein n=1 Tax=Rhodoligotrophos defluvii TaxID=2561934 RepID=UPI0010C9A4AD|nr:aminotransferase class I/II-fold pyridoxal phosphate-dependent enzyme [Rhodoligotrophos defluvii]
MRDEEHMVEFATRAIHHGYDPMSEYGSLTPPVFLNATYAFNSAEEASAAFRGERPAYIYGRTRNPTQTLLEERIANLERAEAGLACASGIAALSATVLSLVSAGEEVIIHKHIYGNAFAFFTQHLARFGVTTRVVDLRDIGELQAALNAKTRIVFFETPANPSLEIMDIAAVSDIAHAGGALVFVDNTFATPALQRPIEFGADLVMHSATKYLGGHGDLIGGLLAGRAELLHRARQVGLRAITGAAMSPLTAFLVLRGLKTLDLRMAQHSASASALAHMLAEHPAVRTVSYPGLPSFPQRHLAERQMSRPGGLISLELNGGMKAGMKFMNNLRLARIAVSLGETETLVQHPASMTHSTYTEADRAEYGVSDGLIRISVGLESFADLQRDFQHALDQLDRD